jgi:hypothetical protein
MIQSLIRFITYLNHAIISSSEPVSFEGSSKLSCRCLFPPGKCGKISLACALYGVLQG